MGIIPYGKQNISEKDIEEVINVLKSDFLTQGPKVQEFEQAFANYIGCKYAVAVSHGTAALHVSALAVNIKPGDKVITTPITFLASANCVKYAGGEVIFADIDPNTYLIDINQIEDKLKREKKIKGIIPVDFAGYPVNLEELRKLADKYGIWILEDACHAPGGYFIDSKGKNQICGNCNYADMSIFSFHPVKHIATGEGGMITTNDENLYKQLLLYRNHGMTKDPEFLNENHGGWYYEMQKLGYNYRITDLQCALGISQLKRADENLGIRNKIAERYDEAFKETKIKTPFRSNDIYHAFHLYVIQVEKRKALYDFLRKNGIYTQVHYIPVHLQPYYRQFGYKKGDFPIAEQYYENCLSLPMYPSLSEEEQEMIIAKVLEFLDA